MAENKWVWLKLKIDTADHRTSLVAKAISVHVKLYIGWGKDGHVDGLYMRSFKCKKFHSE